MNIGVNTPSTRRTGYKVPKYTVQKRNIINLSVQASTSTSVSTKETENLIKQMRQAAMKLHTKKQSKKGEQEESKDPVREWNPTIQGYVNYLNQSKIVYDLVEETVNSNDKLSMFRGIGFERSPALERDIALLCEKYNVTPADMGDEGPGTAYARYIKEKADANIPVFVCHYYNLYFAHMSGGLMIGKKIKENLLDGQELDFYKFEESVGNTKQKGLQSMAVAMEGWAEEDKQACVDDTAEAFKYAGPLLRLIVGK